MKDKNAALFLKKQPEQDFLTVSFTVLMFMSLLPSFQKLMNHSLKILTMVQGENNLEFWNLGSFLFWSVNYLKDSKTSWLHIQLPTLWYS